VWWNIPVITALGRQRQKDLRFKARLVLQSELLFQKKFFFPTAN
jgi:hypothetical protein